MIKNIKNAMITVELGISLVLIVVVIFVTLGLFGDNLKELVASGNFSRTWQNNDAKTFYESFAGRDYSNSQMNVQVMGEQGLQNLRQKANNQLIKLIPDLIATSSTNLADNAAYLGLIINGIVGSPDACEYMKKPSNKLCEEIPLEVKHTVEIIPPKTINIDGKNYTLSSSVSADVGGNTASEKLDSIKKATDDLKDKVSKENDLSRDIGGMITDLDRAVADAANAYKKDEFKANTKVIFDEMVLPHRVTKHNDYSDPVIVTSRRSKSDADRIYNDISSTLNIVQTYLITEKNFIEAKPNTKKANEKLAYINSILKDIPNAITAVTNGKNNNKKYFIIGRYLTETGEEWMAVANDILFGINVEGSVNWDGSEDNAHDKLVSMGYTHDKYTDYSKNIYSQLNKLMSLYN